MNVDEMVNRFLAWRLPKSFSPDNGVSYKRPNYAHPPADHDWPVGTNLFTADETRAMFEHCAGESLRVARAEGLKAAADWVRDRRWEHEKEHGYIEPDTGALSYGSGSRADAKEAYNCELCEIEDGIRALGVAP